MRDPLIIPTDEGLYCPAGDFHIDPWRPVARAVITHAHADHARPGNSEYYSHHAGLPILRHRLGEAHAFHGLEYGEAVEFGRTRVSLHPAGHVLGSAQVRVEHADGSVWVVTGDYKRDADPTCAPFEVVPCDTLITEATLLCPATAGPRWSASRSRSGTGGPATATAPAYCSPTRSARPSGYWRL